MICAKVLKNHEAQFGPLGLHLKTFAQFRVSLKSGQVKKHFLGSTCYCIVLEPS